MDIGGSQRGRGGWKPPREGGGVNNPHQGRPLRREQETQTYQACLRRKSSRCGPSRPRGSSGIMKWSSTNVNWSNLSAGRVSSAFLALTPPPPSLPMTEGHAGAELNTPPTVVVPAPASPLSNDLAPRVRGVHEVPQVVVGHDDPVRLLRQVEQEPEGGGAESSGSAGIKLPIIPRGRVGCSSTVVQL